MKKAWQLPAFFVYSNLYIAICAVLMVSQTYKFLLADKPDFNYLGFVFFSTLCSYSFHYYLTVHSVISSPRIQWVSHYRYVHVILFIVGLTGSIWFILPLLPHWPWLVPAIIATFLYSAPKIPHPLFRSLRKVAIGKTIFLAFIWMYVTALLPLVIAGAGWHGSFTLFIISRFFFIYSICILFDYRDREDDREAGVRSLITYLSEKSLRILFYASVIISCISLLGMLAFGYNILYVIIILIPSLIVAACFRRARRDFSDLFYYYFLDGLMALSALILLSIN